MTRLAQRLVLAQVLDATTFALFMVVIGANGEHTERNPLVALIWALGGVTAVVAVKIAIAAIVGYRQSHPSRPITKRWYVPLQTVLISVATASGIAGAGFNLGAFLVSVR